MYNQFELRNSYHFMCDHKHMNSQIGLNLQISEGGDIGECFWKRTRQSVPHKRTVHRAKEFRLLGKKK